MINRRALLNGATAASAAVFLTGFSARPFKFMEGDDDARLSQLLDRHASALQGGEGASGVLRDHSLEARAEAAAQNTARLDELGRIERSALSPRAAIDYDTARFVYETMKDQYGRYGFSDINLRPSPYVVSQMNGAYYWLAEGIGTRAAMSDAAEAEQYVRTLGEFAQALDDETAQIGHDAGLGVTPPDFIIARTVEQIAALRDADIAVNPLLGPALARAEAAGLHDVGSRAAAVFRDRIAPALDRQIAALGALAPRTTSEAGVWAKPDGDAYYASALRSNTTAGYAPGELHELGREWVRDLTAEIDRLLRNEGRSDGSVSERLATLDGDPVFLKPDSDAGRAEIVAEAERRLDIMRGLMGNGFHVIPDDPVEIRRVSPAIEAGAPGGFYSGSRDPETPSVIFINLRSVGDNALWRLPTLIHHEGIPGHHFQASVLERSGLSLFRRAVRFSAWTEGWALYAEQLADELGAYEGDPYGRIGYLQAQLFRACRVVVDTGLHHARWSREEAVDWMVANGGETRQAAEREIDRYCVYPGQACSFKVGHQQIVALRDQARHTQGGSFDLRAYNDMIVASGPLPMQVLEERVRQWVEHG